MCGISGLVLRPGEQAERELLVAMNQTLAARGPDAEGIFQKQNVGLTHRRLKIIDLSDAANQPMLEDEGRLALVYNGELYNFQELRAQLESQGHRFRTRCDTEVILHAYQEWGTEAFARFNGIFAFALVDWREKNPALYLVRDRFGIKPLFFAEASGRLAFGSTLKPLLELDWIDRGIAPETLYHFLKFAHVPTPLSIFRGVRQLEAGTWLRFRDGKIETHLYWDALALSPAGTAGQHHSEQEWMEELSAVLKRSVKRQLVSDVPVGCFLSGGIDSSLIMMAHTSLGLGPLRSFSIGYADKEFDETPFAKTVAAAFGSEHHELIVGPRDFHDLIPDIPEFFDQPLGDPTLISTMLLAKFARQKVTVTLSGDGGDELFFGYPYEEALLRLRTLQRVPSGLRRGAAGGLRKLLALAPAPVLGDAGRRWLKLCDVLSFNGEAEMLQFFIGTIGPIRLERLASLLTERPDTSHAFFDRYAETLGRLPWREKVSQIFVRTFLLDTVLAKTDRATMGYGLEARVPFLDNELADFSARLPFGLKYRHGTKKYLLRKLLETTLPVADPRAISQRAKQGFSIPLRDWFVGDFKYLLDEYLGEVRLRREGVFVPREIRTLVKQHLQRRENHSHLLWSLVSFQMWKERYLN